MQRIRDRLPNYDHDYDGRPPVEFDGYDPLLAALIREHPEKMPSREIAVNSPDDLTATSRGRVSILASALD